MLDIGLLLAVGTLWFFAGFILGHADGWRRGYKLGGEHGDLLAKSARDLSDSAQKLYNEARKYMRVYNPAEWDTEDDDEP